MADPTLYLFDGHNLLHAGGYADQRELTDTLASFVALRDTNRDGRADIIKEGALAKDEGFGVDAFRKLESQNLDAAPGSSGAGSPPWCPASSGCCGRSR